MLASFRRAVANIRACHVVAEADGGDGDERVVERFTVSPLLYYVEDGGRNDTGHHGTDNHVDDDTYNVVDHPATSRRLLAVISVDTCCPRQTPQQQEVHGTPLKQPDPCQQNEEQRNTDQTEEHRESLATQRLRRRVAVTCSNNTTTSSNRISAEDLHTRLKENKYVKHKKYNIKF